MSLSFAVLLSARLLALTLLIQGAELLYLSRQSSFQSIWNFKNLQPDFIKGLPLNQNWISLFFSDKSFQNIAILQMIAAVLALIYPHFILILILFSTHFLICVRFRGTFNGGSDMMTFVVLTGMLIALLGWQKMGLIYITIHALYSYFKAGLVKARFREWWNGQALPIFLRRSLFLDMHQLADWLAPKKLLYRVLGTSVLIFELAAFALLFFPSLAITYCAIAIIFHMTIYFIFGLNRFFWIWVSTWPPILFSLNLLIT